MNNLKLPPELFSYDLEGLAQREPNKDEQFSVYLWILADVWNAKIESVEKKFKEVGHKLDDSLQDLLNIQLYIILKKEKTLITSLLSKIDSAKLPNDFLQANLFQYTGHHYIICDSPALAIIHFQTALQKYESLGLKVLVALRYNEILHYSSRIGEMVLYKNSLAELKKLDEELNHFNTHLALLGHTAENFMVRENSSSAIKIYKEIIEITQTDAGRRSRSLAVVRLGYLYLKTGAYHSFECLHNEQTSGTVEYYSKIMKIFMEFINFQRTEFKNTKKLFVYWRKEFTTEYFLIFLDIIFEKLLMFEEYKQVIEIYSLLGRVLRDALFPFRMVDLRYQVIYSLIRINEKRKAAELLGKYLNDAKVLDSPVRVAKAKELENLILKISDPAKKELELNLSMHTLSVGDKKINLASLPVVQKVLEICISSAGPIDIYEFYYNLYGTQYDPMYNANRLNSILVRARKLIGIEDIVIRRDGKIEINPEYQLSLVERDNNFEKIRWRRERIIRLLKKTKKPLSMAEIAKHFAVGRCTLLTDINMLVEDKKIMATGFRRAKKYSAL